MFPFLTSTMVASSPRPHVVMFLVDDNGWAGVGYNNPYIVTPTIDALAKEGLTLTRHYTYQYCAPTRGAFLTGRLPYKLAATRANLIPWTLLDGIHLNYSMLPKKLAAANYESAHLGKWHQGVYTPEYTPVGRGFDLRRDVFVCRRGAAELDAVAEACQDVGRHSPYLHY